MNKIQDPKLEDTVKEENENKDTNNPQEQDKPEKKSLAEQLKEDPEIQSELDQRITQALKTAREKWDAEAKLTEDERAKKALEDREEELTQKELAFTLKERTSDTKIKLMEEKLPPDFAELIAKSTGTQEEAEKVIEKIKKVWDEQMTEQVKAGARQAPASSPKETNEEAGSGTGSLAEFALKQRKVK